jgi:hypothetical protein
MRNDSIVLGRARIAYALGISERHVTRLMRAGVARIGKGRGRTSLLRATQGEIERLRRILHGDLEGCAA